jgi:alpha 1,2-mannosyltransferase
VVYGVIPYDHWNQPEWIDENKARQGRWNMTVNKVIYGGSVSFVFILLALLGADLFRLGTETCVGSILEYHFIYLIEPWLIKFVQFFFRHELLQQYRYYWRIESVFP